MTSNLGLYPGGLRVAVLAHALRDGGGASVGRNLLASLVRVAPENRYLAFVPERQDYERALNEFEQCELYVYQCSGGSLGRWWFDERVLPRLVREFEPHVVLALGNRGLSRVDRPQAILCHDPHLFYPVAHYSCETTFRKVIKFYQKRRLARDLRRTQLLLTQTPISEKRLKATFAYGGRTVLCPNAVSMQTLAGAEQEEAMPVPLRALEKRFKLFCLTRYYPHKNLEAVVEAFASSRDRFRDTAVILTIAADQHPLAGKLMRRIERLDLGDWIINVGPLQQRELAAYYRHCQGLLLPSLLESFSSTYVEAMQFECPILTSDLDFAHAVCGDAALYFDPWNPPALADAIVRLRDNSELASELRRRGRARRVELSLSWDKVAFDLAAELHWLAIAAPMLWQRHAP